MKTNTENNRESMKRKIKAILSKATENGASETEIITALEITNKLLLVLVRKAEKVKINF